LNIVIDVFRVGLKLDVADEEEDGKKDGGGDLEHGPRRVESRVICPYMVIMSIYGNNLKHGPLGDEHYDPADHRFPEHFHEFEPIVLRFVANVDERVAGGEFSAQVELVTVPLHDDVPGVESRVTRPYMVISMGCRE